MQYLIIFILIFTLQASDKNNQIYDIVTEYRKDGLNGVKATLEKHLMDKKYWDNVVSSHDTRFGYYESIKYVFIAQKQSSLLQLFELSNNKFLETSKDNAIFGENKGDKLLEGDLATPIGVYNLTRKLQNLDQYYGPLAFDTSYPNLYDKLNKKTGYGIWIHGLPLNGDRTEQNTKGCIVVENNILIQYDKKINYKESILITSQIAIKEVSKNTLANILQSLFIWRDAWINNDLDLYLSFYNNNFIRFDGMKIDAFKTFKKRIFKKEEIKTINFTDINIAPYPNEKNKDMFRITFLEDYKSDSGYKFQGNKELYIIVENNKMSIIIEK